MILLSDYHYFIVFGAGGRRQGEIIVDNTVHDLALYYSHGMGLAGWDVDIVL